MHIKNLKQALVHGFVLKNIDMNTKLRKKAKKKKRKKEKIEKYFVKLMNNAGFRKTKENVIKHRNIKLVKTEWTRNYLASEPN